MDVPGEAAKLENRLSGEADSRSGKARFFKEEEVNWIPKSVVASIK